MADGADVSNFEQVTAMVERATKEWGSVDLLCANAGILRDKSFAKMEVADFAKVLDVHLTGTFYCCKAVWAGMRERNYGRIVVTTSSSGMYGNFGQSNYGAAKAGVAAFTVICALELARYGVRVNAIAPGARTRMTEGAFGQLDFEGDFDPLDPANVAPVVVWLLSDAAAEVSGQVLGITGGLVELYEGWHVVASQELARRWTPEELAAAAPELFGDRPARAPWRPSSLRRIIEAARGGGREG